MEILSHLNRILGITKIWCHNNWCTKRRQRTVETRIIWYRLVHSTVATLLQRYAIYWWNEKRFASTRVTIDRLLFINMSRTMLLVSWTGFCIPNSVKWFCSSNTTTKHYKCTSYLHQTNTIASTIFSTNKQAIVICLASFGYVIYCQLPSLLVAEK